MENSSRQRHTASKNGIVSLILTPLLTGAAVFAVCILLFPLLMLKTDDPASLVPAACVASTALTSFFASASASRKASVHFAAAGLACALVISLLLFGSAFAFGSENDYSFTALLSGTSLIFSLLGSRFGKKNTRRKKKKRRS